MITEKEKADQKEKHLLEEKLRATSKADAIQAEKIKSFEQVMPMWKIVLSQFFDHKMAVIGLVIITFFIFVALLAPVISSVSGIDPETQNPLNRYKPPMSVVYASNDQREDAITKLMRDNPEAAHELQAEIVSKNLITVENPDDALFELVKKEPEEVKSILTQLQTRGKKEIDKMIEGFKTTHLLGTDELGRDVFIRLIYGTRVSMGVGILVAITSALIGLLVGSVAGYYGGIVDTLLMRITDSLLSLPILPIQILIAAVDLGKLPFIRSLIATENENIVKLVFILVIFSWMQVALLVRGSILSIREREFILAARTLGARDSTIILRHMFPNVVAPMLVSITLGVGESILWESALSFLGLGIQQPTASWGNMLNNASDLISEAPFLAILPGVLILVTTISFNYLGDGLQDAIDPKAIRR